MWGKPTEGQGLLQQGAFSVSQGLLKKKKKHFLLQKEVNKAEKNCMFGSRMKGVGTGNKGWCDQKGGLRMSYPKASLFPKRTT